VSEVSSAEVGERRYDAQRHLLWIVALALAVRLIYLCEQGAASVLFYQPLLDEQELARTAAQLLGSHTFGAEPLFKAPLYPLLLAAVMGVCGQYWYWGIRLLQQLAGLLLVALAWDTARRLCPHGRRRLLAADIAGAVLALYAPLIRLEVCINLDSLAVVYQSAALYALLRGSESHIGARLRWCLLAGVLFALSWLNRPTITPVVLLLAGWVLLAWRDWRCALSLCGIPAIAVSLVMGRNYAVSGEALALPWQGGFAFYEANRPGADGRYYHQREFANSATGNPTHRAALEGFDRAVEAGTVAAPAADVYYRAVDRYWFNRGVAEIRRDPSWWLMLMLGKLRDLLSAKEIYSYEDYDVQRELSFVLRYLPLNFGWVFPFALASIAVLPVRKRKGRPTQLVLLYTLGLAGALVLYYTSGRLRMPLVFPMVVLGASGAVTLGSLTGAQRGRLIAHAALVLLGAVISLGDWSGVRSESHRGVEYARLSNAAFADARPELALEYVRRAEAAEPRYPTLPLLRGQALYATGKFPEAREQFRRSMTTLPGDPVAPYNLGASYFYDTEDTTSSRAALGDSISRDHSYWRAAALLALIQAGDGNTSSAGELLQSSGYQAADDDRPQVLTAAAALACSKGNTAEAQRLLQVIRQRAGESGYKKALADLQRAKLDACARAAAQSPE
jgi:tetratricopeptide (TPR) repeat protein